MDNAIYIAIIDIKHTHQQIKYQITGQNLKKKNENNSILFFYIFSACESCDSARKTTIYTFDLLKSIRNSSWSSIMLSVGWHQCYCCPYGHAVGPKVTKHTKPRTKQNKTKPKKKTVSGIELTTMSRSSSVSISNGIAISNAANSYMFTNNTYGRPIFAEIEFYYDATANSNTCFDFWVLKQTNSINDNKGYHVKITADYKMFCIQKKKFSVFFFIFFF